VSGQYFSTSLTPSNESPYRKTSPNETWSKPGYTYYACRTRDRVAPEGHPAFICLDEDKLLGLLTDFFNTRIFGPDRIQLAAATANIAARQAADEHDQKIKAVRYALADIEARQRRLFKILEENDDETGQLYRQAQQRQSELDAEHGRKTAELRDLEQTMPSAAAGAIELLNDMPTAKVNLADAPADRLRPLLDAFAIELHYNLHANKIKIKATVSVDSVPHLAQTAGAVSTEQSVSTVTSAVRRRHPRAINDTPIATTRHLAVTSTYQLA
jgi:hypothetical protein